MASNGFHRKARTKCDPCWLRRRRSSNTKTIAKSQTAILLVDHNVRRVVRMSHYIYVLSLGQIAAEGAPEAFTGDLHEQVKGWLGINF